MGSRRIGWVYGLAICHRWASCYSFVLQLLVHLTNHVSLTVPGSHHYMWYVPHSLSVMWKECGKEVGEWRPSPRGETHGGIMVDVLRVPTAVVFIDVNCFSMLQYNILYIHTCLCQSAWCVRLPLKLDNSSGDFVLYCYATREWIAGINVLLK